MKHNYAKLVKSIVVIVTPVVGGLHLEIPARKLGPGLPGLTPHALKSISWKSVSIITRPTNL